MRGEDAGDAGHETVGQALLICGVSAGALSAASLADVVLSALQGFVAALG
jgi:hypothetical protein